LLFRLIFSLSLIIIVVFSFFYFLMSIKQKDLIEKNYSKVAFLLAKSFESTITKKEDLENIQFLYTIILKTLYSQNDVYLININREEKGKIVVYVSSDSNLIGKEASLDNFYSLEDGRVRSMKIVKEKTPLLKVIVPLRLLDRLPFTYEIFLSLAETESYFQTIKNYFFLTTFFLVLILISLIVFFSKIMIFDALSQLKKGMELVGGGDFQVKLEEERDDEMGEIFRGFNKMVEMLKDSYQKLEKAKEELEEKIRQRTEELEEAKSSLEIRVMAKTKALRDLTENLEKLVKERTKELEESKKELERKIKELEKFQKLTEGRELKMMELKKKIAKLEEKLKEK
jgi:methyl-accepting chemotaxis protein